MRRIRISFLSRIIIIVLTALAVTGGFSLTAAESLHGAAAGLYVAAHCYFPDQMTEPVLFAGDDDSCNSLLLDDSQRSLFLPGINNTAQTKSSSQLMADLQTSSINVKDTIILRLRI